MPKHLLGRQCLGQCPSILSVHRVRGISLTWVSASVGLGGTHDTAFFRGFGVMLILVRGTHLEYCRSVEQNAVDNAFLKTLLLHLWHVYVSVAPNSKSWQEKKKQIRFFLRMCFYFPSWDVFAFICFDLCPRHWKACLILELFKNSKIAQCAKLFPCGFLPNLFGSCCNFDLWCSG